MVRKNKATIAVLFTLLFAATMFLILPASSVWAEGNDGDTGDKTDKKEMY